MDPDKIRSWNIHNKVPVSFDFKEIGRYRYRYRYPTLLYLLQYGPGTYFAENNVFLPCLMKYKNVPWFLILWELDRIPRIESDVLPSAENVVVEDDTVDLIWRIYKPILQHLWLEVNVLDAESGN